MRTIGDDSRDAEIKDICYYESGDGRWSMVSKISKIRGEPSKLGRVCTQTFRVEKIGFEVMGLLCRQIFRVRLREFRFGGKTMAFLAGNCKSENRQCAKVRIAIHKAQVRDKYLSRIYVIR